MQRTLGVFHELHLWSDLLWNQCEGPMGDAGNGVHLRGLDRSADHALIINWPVPPGGSRRLGGWKRHAYKALRKSTTPLRVDYGYRWLGRPPERTWALIYEPPPLIEDWFLDFTRRHCSRIYAPDPRATHPVTLPAMWTFDDDLAALLSMPPPSKPLPLAAINSGRPAGKTLLAGHEARLNFFQQVQRAQLPLALYGRGIPSHLQGGGSVSSKANILRPARYALVIENYTEGDQYVTEKLWDALLCWCLPIYYGSSAADRLIPADAMIRLPDLGPAGLEVVRSCLSDTGLWDRRLPAIAEARRMAMGELRMVEWIKRELGWA